MKVDGILEQQLGLQAGDIIIYEMPYEDAKASDFFPFDSLNNFTPSHSAMWTGSYNKAIAHSVREGYRLPGIRLTNVTESRCVIFRLLDLQIATRAAEIFRTWALSSTLYSKEDYLQKYPERFWRERHARDLKEFFTNGNAKVSGPATTFSGPRAEKDLSDISRNIKKAEMTEEGLRRAIKFASRIDLTSPLAISKGQRCTPILVAAVQAAILEPIVKKADSKVPFKDFKEKKFEEYADLVLVKGWRETELGKKVIEAVKSGDYTKVFPAPFAVDQRYILPNILFDALSKSDQFKIIGRFSYFHHKLEVIDKNNQSIDFTIQKKYSPKI